MTEPATSQGEHDWHQKLAEDKFEMAMQIVKLGGQLDAERARADAMRSALEEMERTLTSPSRQLLDSTRRELEPWLLLIQAALASAPGKSTADELRRLRALRDAYIDWQEMPGREFSAKYPNAAPGVYSMFYKLAKAAQPERAERIE